VGGAVTSEKSGLHAAACQLAGRTGNQLATARTCVMPHPVGKSGTSSSNNLFMLVKVSQAAIHAAFLRWPKAFPEGVAQALDDLRAPMRELRPQVVYGVDSMIIARLLREGREVQEIAGQWEVLRPEALERLETSSGELVEYFQQFRWVRDAGDAVRMCICA
jgi:hypothetical protein